MMERNGLKHEFSAKWKTSLAENFVRHSVIGILLICKDLSLLWNLENLSPWFAAVKTFKKLLSLKKVRII